MNVAQLFELVKKYDNEFNPKPVNPAFLNEDGTPKVFYHGTNADFTVFDRSKGTRKNLNRACAGKIKIRHYKTITARAEVLN